MPNARAQNALQRVVAVFLRQSDIEFDEEIMAPLGRGLRYGIVFPYGCEHEFEADRLDLSLMSEAVFQPIYDIAARRGTGRLPGHEGRGADIRCGRDVRPERAESMRSGG
ncbi:hypothetical protein RM543_17620 [Roseicyclus sp. F158]|uniref:Uncharacterized protein n=1 Tax=Tropicimonas omnivorans TaxID=3075590 RepID=A0ABU3DLB3_9RHOB|nr:hypothetical protein [Roseicyclus sp. F158]MDT0684503.1 hypothetical protein [Roseicyclus sp. F158]